jgi:hypothetical protein
MHNRVLQTSLTGGNGNPVQPVSAKDSKLRSLWQDLKYNKRADSKKIGRNMDLIIEAMKAALVFLIQSEQTNLLLLRRLPRLLPC